MLPILEKLQRELRPNHTYIEDLDGDGALIGIAVNFEGTVVGVEIMSAMVCPDEVDDSGAPVYAISSLVLSPEGARELAMRLTMTSMDAEAAMES